MSGFQVLVVAGTHGNEINAPWLIDQTSFQSDLINTQGVRIVNVIGNPKAVNACRRYLDRDLNRSFREDLLGLGDPQDKELKRAKELLSLYGPNGSNPCQIAIDLHSTTSSMGSCIVVYGRRPPDLALAALIQSRLGTPIYLHEGDPDQDGFLVEAWPCGLVIEIGPISQGVLDIKIVERTKLVLEVALEVIAKVRLGISSYPKEFIVHRHIGSIDYPRNEEGKPTACIHPLRQGCDWMPLVKGDPLFLRTDGSVVCFDKDESYVPVFINEASYAEKGISMSFSKREVWQLKDFWQLELNKLTC